MKTLRARMRKSIKAFMTLLLALQIGIFSPIQAQASFFTDVLHAAANAVAVSGGWPSDLPPPDALIALIVVAESCSKSSIMDCVIAAEADPTIRDQLKDHMEKIDAGIAIYNDISTGNYLDLLEKLGKTAGCAAAALVTGVPICALAEALAAVAGAVVDAAGAAAEEAGEWLQELDFALFGGTPYMGSDDYYNQFWRPFTADYVRRGTSGKVNDATALTPRFVALAGGGAQSATEAGLAVRNINEIYAKCMDYYGSVKSTDAATQCDSQRKQFKARADLLIALGKQMNTAGPVIDTAVKAQLKNWEDRLRTAATASGYDIDKKMPKGPDGAQYKALLSSRIGSVSPHTWCLDPICYESFDGYDGGNVNSIAYEIFAAWSKSDFKAAPLQVMNTTIVAAAPDLQKIVDSYTKAAVSSAGASASDARTNMVLAFHGGFKSSFSAINATCKGLTQTFNSSPYSTRCLTSEPIQGCGKFIAELSTSQVDTSSDASVQKYIKEMGPGLKSCVDSSQALASEWQKMDITREPFMKGWTAVCNKDKNKDRCAQAPLPLGVAYDACVAVDIASVGQAATNGVAKIASLTFKPSTPIAVNAKSVAGKTAYGKQQVDTSIAGGFCAQEGAQAISTALATDPDNVFGGQPDMPVQAAPQRSKRDKGKLALAAKIVADSSGDCRYMQTASGPDEYHIVCTGAAAYQGCLSHFTVPKDISDVQVCHPGRNGQSENLCCTQVARTSADIGNVTGTPAGINSVQGTAPLPGAAVNNSGGPSVSSKTSAPLASPLGAGAPLSTSGSGRIAAPSPGSSLGVALPGAKSGLASSLAAPKTQPNVAVGTIAGSTLGTLHPPVNAAAGRTGLTAADIKLLAAGQCTLTSGKTDAYSCKSDAGMKSCDALLKDHKLTQCTRIN